MGKHKAKKKSKTKGLIMMLLIIIIAAGAILAYKITQDKQNNIQTVSEEDNVLVAQIDEKEVEIFKRKQ